MRWRSTPSAWWCCCRCMMPWGGSVRPGRPQTLLLAATGLAFVAAWPLFWLMHHPTRRLVLLGQLGFVLSSALFVGAQPTVMVEEVPAGPLHGVALGYNVTLGIVGGLSPLVATWLVTAPTTISPGLHGDGRRGGILLRHSAVQRDVQDAAAGCVGQSPNGVITSSPAKLLRGGHIFKSPSYCDCLEVIEAMFEGDGPGRSGGSIAIPSAEASDDPGRPRHGGEGMGISGAWFWLRNGH